MKLIVTALLLTANFAFADASCYTGSAIGCLFEKQVGVNHAAVSVHNPGHMGNLGNAVSPFKGADSARIGTGCHFPLQMVAGVCK